MTRNLADLDLSETLINIYILFIYRIQADSFHKFNSIPAVILPQSENISATNGWQLFACLHCCSYFSDTRALFVEELPETVRNYNIFRKCVLLFCKYPQILQNCQN